MSDTEHTECSVCGYQPEPDRIPPHFVLSLSDEDIDDEFVQSYPFGGSLSVPFACSDECWLDAQEDRDLIADGGTGTGDVEQFYHEREEQYRGLNIREHIDGERYIVDCPGCAEPMVLGEGWMGCSIPTCPDCNDTADSWRDDPRISERSAETLANGEADVTELVRS